MKVDVEKGEVVVTLRMTPEEATRLQKQMGECKGAPRPGFSITPWRSTHMETSELLAERGKTHGDYSDDARCAMRICDVLQGEMLAREDRGQPALTVVQRHSLYMIAFKMARIVTGTAGFKDHWDDIAGYAKLVADRCPAIGEPIADFVAKAIRNAPPFECPDVGQAAPASWQPQVEERRQRIRRIQQDIGGSKWRREGTRGRRATEGPPLKDFYY